MKQAHTVLERLCSRSSVQDTLAERLEVCSSISLPFQQLEAGNLAFCLAVAPGQDQASLNGLNSLAERGKRSSSSLTAGVRCHFCSLGNTRRRMCLIASYDP